MSIANSIELLGGLGFFLFGMTLLGDGLKRVAGSKLKMILEKLTYTTFRGVLLGTLVTAVIQSSSATTVMVVGFVNSGIMKLSNAIGVIMGANIGTTATSWILVLAGAEGNSLFSSSTFFALVAFIGIILYFFCKNNSRKSVGMIMLAFSVLMSGMRSMSDAMMPLSESPAFLEFIAAVSHPMVAIAVGIVVTAIIQSCSASIGILQALSVTGVISYEIAIPMVLGMCIGACAPVLLSAIGANVSGKRAALVYLLFNLVGSLVLMVPFYLLQALIELEFLSSIATSMGIAVVNTVYKVSTTLILMPFAPQLEKLAVGIVRDKAEYDDTAEHFDPLNERFLRFPAVALEQVGKLIDQMAGDAFGNLQSSVALLRDFRQEDFDGIMRREDEVDSFEDRISAYLVRLNVRELRKRDSSAFTRYLNCLGNLERISDHAVNLAEAARDLHEKDLSFPAESMRELQVCIDAVCEATQLTQEALLRNDREKARMVEPLEDVIDILTRDLKRRHVDRMQNSRCAAEPGFIFYDCVIDLERIADHCSNLAVSVLEETAPHSYLHDLKRREHASYHIQMNFYESKYCSALASVREKTPLD